MITTTKRPNTGLNEEQADGVVHIFTRLLSDEELLYTKTRNYHWNVVGPRFHDLHEFFEKQYEELAKIVDDVAEHIRYQGGRAPGTLREFLDHAQLREKPGDVPDADGMIRNLRDDHETIIRNLRHDILRCEEHRAADAVEFLSNLIVDHQKMAWMLRSMLEKER
ncbi:MAG: Dps family protein [Bryobacteraceae bacterium]